MDAIVENGEMDVEAIMLDTDIHGVGDAVQDILKNGKTEAEGGI